MLSEEQIKSLYANDPVMMELELKLKRSFDRMDAKISSIESEADRLLKQNEITRNIINR